MNAARVCFDDQYDGEEKKPHVMIIDDEDALCRLFEQALESQGYQVSAFTDSALALQAFNEQSDRYDLVITDQTMPRYTGADLVQKMLQIRPELPIVLMTGYSEVIDEAKAFQLGVKKYLRKPFDLQFVYSIVESTLNRPS